MFLVLAGSAAAGTTTVCRGSCVDLSVSISDAVSSLVPGGPVVYVVTVRNSGPSSVSSVTLTDLAPPALRNVVDVPTSGSYNASTHLWSGLSLGSGRSATMLVAGTIDPVASGALANTVTVAPPAGTTDTNAANNTATDTDTLTGVADLSVSLSDGVTSLVAGRSTVYTVTVKNNCLSTVGSVVLTDTLPSSLTGVVFAPTTGSYSPATHVWSGLSLAAGQSVTMTVTGTVAPTATGSLVNAVTVAPPAGVIDPVSGNNSASDTDKLSAQADLSISNSDGTTTAAPGSSTTYTVVVSNPGPSTATGATVSDTLPAAISSDTWTGTNGTSGTGPIHASVTVPAGGTVSYTIVAAINAAATGSLANTATVTAPAGLTDPNTANNSATDTDTLVPQTDLSVTNSDGVTSVVPGTTTSYTIVVTNHGPLTATGALVADTPPAAVTSDSWTGSNGTSGTGPINATITLASGSSVTYTLLATVAPGVTGTLTDTATATAPAGLTDSNPADNTAIDTDTLNPTADLQITNSDGATSVTAGASTSYTVTVTNAGPSTATGATVTDPIPAGVDSFSWTGSDGTSGSAAINTTVTLAPGATIAYTVAAAIDSSATGTIADTAAVTAPASVTDTNPANNADTDTDTVAPAGIIVTGRVKLGDLFLCNLSSFTTSPYGRPISVSDMDGLTVRQFLAVAEQKLGGASVTSTDSFEAFDSLAADISVAFENGVPLSFFADPYLSTRSDCTPVDWQPNQIISYSQSQFTPDGSAEASGVLDYIYGTVYINAPYELIVGDTDPGGYYIDFDQPGNVAAYLAGSSNASAALTETMSDPQTTASGVFGGDVTALAVDVVFSDAYAPRTCSPPGSANSNGAPIAGIPCPWGIGDMLTFGQVGWESDQFELLNHDFDTVESHGLTVGDPAGYHLTFTSFEALNDFLTTSGPAEALTGSFVNPAGNTAGTGALLSGDVIALQLDVDYYDAGLIPTNAGLNFGNLTLCDVPGFPLLTGDTVRQFLAIANAGLAGEPTGYTPAELDTLTSDLGVSFDDTEPLADAAYLFNGPCPAGEIEHP